MPALASGTVGYCTLNAGGGSFSTARQRHIAVITGLDPSQRSYRVLGSQSCYHTATGEIHAVEHPTPRYHAAEPRHSLPRYGPCCEHSSALVKYSSLRNADQGCLYSPCICFVGRRLISTRSSLLLHPVWTAGKPVLLQSALRHRTHSCTCRSYVSDTNVDRVVFGVRWGFASSIDQHHSPTTCRNRRQPPTREPATPATAGR